MKERRITAEDIRKFVAKRLIYSVRAPSTGTEFLCHCFPSRLRGEFGNLLNDFTTLDDYCIVLLFDEDEQGEFEDRQTCRFMFAELLALLVEDGQ